MKGASHVPCQAHTMRAAAALAGPVDRRDSLPIPSDVLSDGPRSSAEGEVTQNGEPVAKATAQLAVLG